MGEEAEELRGQDDTSKLNLLQTHKVKGVKGRKESNLGRKGQTR